MVRHDNMHRYEWPMGKILRVFPDPQGIIRSVEVEEGGRVSLRTVSYLVPLDHDCYDNERDNTKTEMVSDSQDASFNEADEPPTKFESTIRGNEVPIHLSFVSPVSGLNESPPAQSAVMQLSGLAETHSHETADSSSRDSKSQPQRNEARASPCSTMQPV